MIRSLTLLGLFVSCATLFTACPPPAGTGEGEGEGAAGEGEGAAGEGEGAAGEGEGAAGEGEGAAAGEGEGAAGEGEGAAGEGEGAAGEGEGAAGEGEGAAGEGEGAAGEGEGEGEGGSAPTCDPTLSDGTACGGVLDGTWSVVDVCLSGSVALEGSCDATVLNENLTASGALVVGAGNFAYDVTVGGSLELGVACAVVPSCDQIAAGLHGIFQGTWTCAAGAGGCDCNGDNVNLDDASSGGFTDLATGKVEVNNNDRWLYCSETDGLSLREAPDSNGGNVGLRPTYVLTP